MKIWQKISIFSPLILVGLWGFQNCSQTPVTLMSFQMSSNLEISGSICIPQDYNLMNFFIVNLSVKPHFDSIHIDADQDGLSDQFELESGFDPKIARSQGPILDSICFYLTEGNNCKDINVLCDDPKGENLNEFGLSDCDVNALNLNGIASNLLGLDSDGDGIPDKIELLFELDPSSKDALGDYDNDDVLNIEEVHQNSHPRQKSSSKSNSSPLFIQKLPFQNRNCDEGEETYDSEWVFFKNQKIYDIKSQSDPERRKNHIWIIAILEKNSSPLRIERKIKYIHLKREYTKEEDILEVSSSNFFTAIENFF